MCQIMTNSVSDNGMFGLKPGDTALQTDYFQAQEGSNGQTKEGIANVQLDYSGFHQVAHLTLHDLAA